MALLSRTWSVYPSARGLLKTAAIDVGSDTFKAVLLSGSYTPGTLTATQRSDVAAYALGTDQTVSLSNSSGTVSTSASASWSGSLSPRYVAIYSDTHASDALLCVVDLGGVNGPSNFTLPAQTLFTFDELTVGGGDYWLANLPAGMTLGIDTEFGNLLETSINADGVYVSGDDPAVGAGELRTDCNVVDGTAPGTDTNVWMGWYTEGSLGGGTNGEATKVECYPSLNCKDLYFCTQMKLSSPYAVHEVDEKLFYPVSDKGGANGSSYFGFRAEDGNSANCLTGPITFHLSPQTGSYGTQIFYSSAATEFVRGSWVTVEGLFVGNTTGNVDGSAKLWVNGTLILDVPAVNFFEGTDGYWTVPRVDGTRGGGNSAVAVPTGGQNRRFARLRTYHGNLV